MKKAVVHVRCNAGGKIKREKREGRETIVLPSYAAKADTILNGIFYPREELKSSFAGLNRTPAPLGHPTIRNKFVPALDPEALARNHIFAWNENAKWDGDRIALDVVIDEARAKESEGGRTVLNAIEKQEPICTSTGLLCSLEEAEGQKYRATARRIEWDHVALLLNEDPAITPEEGVGIFVNSASDEATEIEVINSDLESAVNSTVTLLQTDNASGWERLKSALIEAFGSEREPSANRKEADMTVEEQIKELSEKVNALGENNNKVSDVMAKAIGDAVANAVKPLTDNLAEMKANQDAKDKAELDGLVAKIVKANILDEEGAKELTLNAARKLAEKAKPGKAAGLNGAFGGGDETDEFAGYDMNANIDGDKTGKEVH